MAIGEPVAVNPENRSSAASGRSELSDRLRLLILSHIAPFRGSSGQQQRIRYTLEAARQDFHVTFATCVPRGSEERARAEMAGLCDASVIWPAIYARTPMREWMHRLRGIVYALARGVKRSNYAIGKVELSPARIAAHLGDKLFDAVLFEYWHAAEAAQVFRSRAIPCVLDMHNILWRAYQRQLATKRWLPGWIQSWAVDRYRKLEEESWVAFDALVAINREEEAYVRARSLRPGARVFYAPMGVALDRWPYRWEPAAPVRIGFYGNLASPENQEGALRCLREIMPGVWEHDSDAELWLVGGHPPARLLSLAAQDPRVHVTGFLPDVGDTLRSMSCVVCPWSGGYGFRSRIVEMLSLGVPVVASRDAVRGMELEDGKGILLADDGEGLARLVLRLLRDPELARAQSRMAREEVERLFTVEKTYGKWLREMHAWLRDRREVTA